MDFKYQIGETTYIKTMPKSTKIRMLRNTSTNTCHEVNLCVTIAYGTYTLSLSLLYYGVT